MHCLQLQKYSSFWFPPGFYEIILLHIVLHDALHVRVGQIIPRLILHTILDVKPHINFMNEEGCQFFVNFMCDAYHHKLFGSGLKTDNKVFRHKVFLLDFFL